MKRSVFVLLVILRLSSSAQNDPFFSQYMMNPVVYNPGWMADVSLAYVSFQHRSQWAGYSGTFDGDGGAPSVQMASFVLPMDGQVKAAGATLTYDQQGPTSTLYLRSGAAYSLNVGRGELSIGVMPSLINRSVDFGQLRFEDPNDPLNTQTKESQTQLDASAGIFFKGVSGFFGGLAVDHLLEPEVISVQSGGREATGTISRIYYLHSGMNIELNRDFNITPSFIFRTDTDRSSFDISGVGTYRDLMWAGLSYRRSEAVVLLIGYNFLEQRQLKVGYSFDYIVNDKEAKSPTSHEIFIRYDLPSLILGGRKAVKTPRFSF